MSQLEIATAAHPGNSPTELLASVPTGSHGLCLVTLTESTLPIAGTTVFCGIRELDDPDGIVIHTLLPDAPPPEALWLENVHQLGARRYDAPVPCAVGC